MSRSWKEPYTREAACELGIRELEGGRIVRWDKRGIRTERPEWLLDGADPEWIYFVHACGFTFAFFSREMMLAYSEHYKQRILPSRIRNTPHCNHGLRQDVFARLPLYLREESKRVRVVKALEKALVEFNL